MSRPGFLSPQVSRRRGHPSHHMHVHRLVWPEATVGELSSPSREETQTHEGQVETVPHVEERLVQTGRSRNHLGKQTGRVGGGAPSSRPGFWVPWAIGCPISPHICGAASFHTSSLHATQNGFISDDHMLNPTHRGLRP